jgi:RHS repeat-associated protein
MSSATVGANTVVYTVNGLEQRVSKTGPTAVVPTGAAYYAFDEAGQLVGEYDANLSPLYETVYLGSTPVGVLKQSGSAATSTLQVVAYNVWADHLATPRVVTRNSDQAIVWRWDAAEPFGATAADQNPNAIGTFAYNQRFPGQVFDSETGNFQNWHRDYKAALGRYVQSDPIGLQGGINTYQYVGGNPLSFRDPDGLAPCVCTPFGCVCHAVPRPHFDPDYPLFPPAANSPFPPSANDPRFGGGGGGCNCDDLKRALDKFRSVWLRSSLNPTTPFAVRASQFAAYQAAVAVYESMCGPYVPPQAPPEPPRDKIDDFYGR